jgi:hypothetical protein
MDNTTSNPFQIPTSAMGCINDEGNLSSTLHFMYLRNNRQKQCGDDEKEDERDKLLKMCFDNSDVQCAPNIPKKQLEKNNITLRRLNNGTTQQIRPRDSSWYFTYVHFPKTEEPKFMNKFRRCFVVVTCPIPIFWNW